MYVLAAGPRLVELTERKITVIIHWNLTKEGETGVTSEITDVPENIRRRINEAIAECQKQGCVWEKNVDPVKWEEQTRW